MERKQKWFSLDVVDGQLVDQTPELAQRREWNRKIVQNPSLAREYNMENNLEMHLSNPQV